jgi:hypothetical protein
MTHPTLAKSKTAVPEAIDETDLPTQPARAQAPARLQGSDGYTWRPEGDRGAACARSQKTIRLTAVVVPSTGA